MGLRGRAITDVFILYLGWCACRASRLRTATPLALEAGQAMVDARARGKRELGKDVSYKGRHDLLSRRTGWCVARCGCGERVLRERLRRSRLTLAR